MTDPAAPAIRDAWRALVPNYDAALQNADARAHLVSLNAAGFDDLTWREALAERMAEYPNFFGTYDYAWCDERDCFDFPIEAAYQIRALNAAIGLWVSDFPEKPTQLPLGRIVARTTYLAKFDEATPRAQPAKQFDFIVCPLGWLEFIHRYFAAFGATYPQLGRGDTSWRSHCDAAFGGIAVNLIASAANGIDYVIPAQVDAIVRELPEFSTAPATFVSVSESSLSRDLAYAAHDFALCHEVAHIAAGDHRSVPDEFRADEWGLAAYCEVDPILRTVSRVA